jgi:hypothetical protein
MDENEIGPERGRERSCLGKTMAVAGILVSVALLLNLTFGVVELPDNLPIIGNLDEAAAAAIFFTCLRYLGLDVLPFKPHSGQK